MLNFANSHINPLTNVDAGSRDGIGNQTSFRGYTMGDHQQPEKNGFIHASSALLSQMNADPQVESSAAFLEKEASFDMDCRSMKKKTVAELGSYLRNVNSDLLESVLSCLESDTRAGVRSLIAAARRRRQSKTNEARRLQQMRRFESDLEQQGFHLIAGVDEAGMAPLAGPVVAAAVILPSGYCLEGLNDSKKIHGAHNRCKLARMIQSHALAWNTGWATPAEIDVINIYHAGLLAMRRAIEGLQILPDYILVDARTIPGISSPQKGIIHGDALSLTIAAASVLAKTSRDAYMEEMDEKYPGYGFAAHKGYPTKAHLRALSKSGPLPIHRRSFGPVRVAMGLAGTKKK